MLPSYQPFIDGIINKAKSDMQSLMRDQAYGSIDHFAKALSTLPAEYNTFKMLADHTKAFCAASTVSPIFSDMRQGRSDDQLVSTLNNMSAAFRNCEAEVASVKEGKEITHYCKQVVKQAVERLPEQDKLRQSYESGCELKNIVDSLNSSELKEPSRKNVNR